MKVAARCICSHCKEVGHTRRNCPARPASRGKCLLCADVPWRRQAPRCPGCKKYFAPERRLTIEDVMDRPAEDRRVEP